MQLMKDLVLNNGVLVLSFSGIVLFVSGIILGFFIGSAFLAWIGGRKEKALCQPTFMLQGQAGIGQGLAQGDFSPAASRPSKPGNIG